MKYPQYIYSIVSIMKVCNSIVPIQQYAYISFGFFPILAPALRVFSQQLYFFVNTRNDTVRSHRIIDGDILVYILQPIEGAICPSYCCHV